MDARYKKGQSRLYLLMRHLLESWDVLLKTFFDSVVASAIVYGIVCYI